MVTTIYHKPTCTTCRRVFKALQETGIDVHLINYYIDPISKRTLKGLLKKMNMPARDLLRTKESIYKKLNIAYKHLSEDEIIDLMVRYPDLIQRPIVEKGLKAVLARPPERVNEIL